jgi:hypothetical protein
MNAEDKGVDDSQLNSASQMAVRNLVRALPEETVSMAWRSSLNEQLHTLAVKKQKKRRLLWFATPTVGISLVTALAFVLMFQPAPHHPISVPDRGIESAILSDHHSSTLSNEVSTAGLNFNEASSDANDADPEDGVWSEDDVESI